MSETSRMNIVEFLEARITEDETAARSAIGAGPHWEPMTEETPNGENIYYTVEVLGVLDSVILDVHSSTAEGRAQADHIARHDPARVLAECAAKRAALALWEPPEEFRDYDREGAFYNGGVEDVLLRLAAVYKDHADYQQEWNA